MSRVLHAWSLLVVLAGVVMLAGAGGTEAHAAEPTKKNCWEGTNGGGAFVHFFADEATANRICEADGAHLEMRADLCGVYHTCLSD